MLEGVCCPNIDTSLEYGVGLYLKQTVMRYPDTNTHSHRKYGFRVKYKSLILLDIQPIVGYNLHEVMTARNRFNNTKKNVKLPKTLKPLFWDYEFKSICWDVDSELITNRILSSGDWDSIVWLRTVLSDKELKEILLKQNGAGLTPERIRFWELVLGLPARKVDAWLKTCLKGVWENRLVQ